MRRLNDARLFNPGMPIQYVRIIAAHLLRLTKRYSPDCGGGSEISTIPAVGSPQFVDDAAIVELEKQLETIEAAMRKVLVFSPGVEGKDINTETIEERAKALAQAVSAARGLFIRVKAAEPSTGQIGRLAPSILPTNNSPSGNAESVKTQDGPPVAELGEQG